MNERKHFGLNAVAARTTLLASMLCWREHELIAARMLAAVGEFSARCGYTPPYWELMRLAELARSGLLAQGR